jgi:hypothetical protein
MSNAVTETIDALCMVTHNLPVGTNLALLQCLWAIVSGKLLPNRGALIPALRDSGLTDQAAHRAWAGFRYGVWDAQEMLLAWQKHVTQQPHWRVHSYEGYHPKPVDLTGFWRPALQRWSGKHYYAPAGKALPAVEVGLIGRVGSVNRQRVILLTDLVRSDPDNPSTADLTRRLLQRVGQSLPDNEMPVLDAGFELRQVQDAKLPRYVLRLAKNLTARRNKLPDPKGLGRPCEYGDYVRPLPRQYKGKQIPATPPDRVEQWEENGLDLRAEFWDDLVRSDVKVSATASTFCVAAIHDPRFLEPWLLACPLRLSGPALRGLFYDRWPVEHPPLIGKQMLGGARQFVSHPESSQRLPELVLLAGAMLTYLAATLPAQPTGFWDRRPKPTAGRLRRVLAKSLFPDSYPLAERFRKKASVFGHLATGIEGRRQQKETKAA